MTDKADAKLFRHMLAVAQANGFESPADAIARAVKAEAENLAMRDHNKVMVDRLNQTIEWLQEDPGATSQIERLIAARDWPLRQILAAALQPNPEA